MVPKGGDRSKSSNFLVDFGFHFGSKIDHRSIEEGVRKKGGKHVVKKVTQVYAGVCRSHASVRKPGGGPYNQSVRPSRALQ